MADRQRIEQTYAQGATQLYAQTLQANCDSKNGAVMNFYIPGDMRIINKIMAKVQMSSFRSYSKATENASSQVISSSTSDTNTYSSSDGGGVSTTTSDGGGTSITTSDGGDTQTTTSSGGGQTSGGTSLESSNILPDETDGQAVHNHAMPRNARLAIVDDNLKIVRGVTFVWSGAHVHPEHTHDLTPHSHSITLRKHSHSLTYTGELLTPTWEGIQSEIMTVGGDQSGISAGSYALTVILDNNYQWPDGVVGTLDIPWEIARAGIAAVPSYTGTLTWTGEAQAPEWAGYVPSQMTMTGDANGTNAGNYSTSFTPDSNHQWPDGTFDTKTISWTIQKVEGSLSLTVSSLELRASAMSGIIGVTRAGDGIITATSSNTSVATVAVSGTTITVTAKAKGNATITVSVAEGSNHTAPANKTVSVVVSLPTSVLNDNSWGTIQDVAAAGNAANFWSVGDSKDVVINGKVGNFTFSNLTVKAFILGFDHNSAREGTKKIHFMLGKLGAADIALCDSQFGNEQTSAGYFHMNTSRTNSGGWDGCAMNKTLLNGSSNSLLTALPSDLQSVIQSVTKYTDNTGGGSNTVSYVTGKPCKLFLPAEFEVFGVRSYANSAEQNYQQQYAYFKAGNSKIANRHTAVTTAVWWWLRSPYYNNTTNFCSVYTDGNITNNSASWSAGVRACFCVSAA